MANDTRMSVSKAYRAFGFSVTLLRDNGYHFVPRRVWVHLGEREQMVAWLNTISRDKHWLLFDSGCWFTYERDAVLFKLRWINTSA
jgi:hypothetical protein